MNNVLLPVILAIVLTSCGRTSPVPKKSSSNWQADQISLTGEWYPAVALRGAADSLDDYLQQSKLSSLTTPSLTLYLDYTLQEDILPQHRAAYESALNAILLRAQQVCSARGITARRGAGAGGLIQHGPHAEPKLILETRFYEENGVIEITITNMSHEPYSRVKYEKDFRGVPRFKEETPL